MSNNCSGGILWQLSMTHDTSEQAGTTLIVFADDWGRHPSSCQHLVRHLLPGHQVYWVNTIGMRRPRLVVRDLARGFAKARGWCSSWLPGSIQRTRAEDNPRILAPPMWPGFGRRWQRRANATAVARCVNGALGPRTDGRMRVAVTTLPITADLVGRLDVDRWVYYCVDDFSVWPGLDGNVCRRMEVDLVRRVDTIVCASGELRRRLTNLDAESAAVANASLLPHGVELDGWQEPVDGWPPVPDWWNEFDKPLFLFWGLIDRRLDLDWCRSLAEGPGTFVLVGPSDQPDRRLKSMPGVRMTGALPLPMLPGLAARSDVLVMPYADLDVTRAMQPLKLCEYLATSKPVVVPRLPSTDEWQDCADVVEDAEQFVRTCRTRVGTGLPAAQAEARRRLAGQGWSGKALRFERLLCDGGREACTVGAGSAAA